MSTDLREWRGATACLVKDSPFHAIFRGTVPIKNFIPCLVKLEGVPGETEAYMLAWDGCTADQKQKIAETVTRLRSGTPAEFLKFMNAGGDMPIRVSQTHGAAIPTRMFL